MQRLRTMQKLALFCDTLSHGVSTHMASRNTDCSSLASLIGGPPRGPVDPRKKTKQLGVITNSPPQPSGVPLG